MPSFPDVADGCAEILALLLRFLGSWTSPSTSPGIDEAAVSLFVVLSMAYFASVIVERFAGVVLEYLHLAAPPPAAAVSVCLAQFVGLFFNLVFAWLLIIAVLLAAFSLLGAGKTTTGPGYVLSSWNELV